MTVQDLQKAISDLEKILSNSTGMDKLELNETIFELKNKLANLITSPLDDLNVSITQEDIDNLSQAASELDEATASAQEKNDVVQKGLGIGKKILTFL